MEILNGKDKESILKAVELLEAGDVVAFPTETVYGLGAVAFYPYAVAKIFEVKKRPHFDPLIVHLDGPDRLPEYVSDIPEDARRLMKVFWPGLLTMIFRKKASIPDIVTPVSPRWGFGSLPSRRPLAHQGPSETIAAPSANTFGYMSPTRVVTWRNPSRRVLLSRTAGLGIRDRSTIVSFRQQGVFIHRHGAISIEELSEHVRIVDDERAPGTCETPGELPFHYAPMKPLRLVNGPADVRSEASSYLAFRDPPVPVKSKYVRVLSPSGDPREAASNFFSFLIELDRDDVDIIYAEKLPETGIGRAVMERLKKASRRHSLQPVDNLNYP